MKGICDVVRETAAKVAEKSKHVRVDKEAIVKLAVDFKQNPKSFEYTDWADCDFHYYDAQDPESVVDYIFVIDSLNFCFWPHTWEYGDLGTSLKNILLKDKKAFKPANLIKLSFESFKEDFFAGIDFPLIQERYRIIKEVAGEVLKNYNGEFSNVVKKANNDAEEVKKCVKLFNVGIVG